jgi:inosine/xanthosine triphosphate pyrophosphatase family protein
MADARILITYVTASTHKREELAILSAKSKLGTGQMVGEVFNIVPVTEVVPERLEVELEKLVAAEADAAYRRLRVPCVVEHAGLVFENYLGKSYPGGLTKPMWNALGDKFIEETNSAGRRAVARAVVAYCDGKTIRTFPSETRGTLSPSPRGSRQFYWDTVFIPDDSGCDGKTYAEIVDDPSFGLEYKVTKLSQSAKAMLCFLEARLKVGAPDLWPQ